MCLELGFSQADPVALDVLLDVTCQYLKAVAQSASEYAEHYGRTEVSADDLGQAITDVGDTNSINELRVYCEMVCKNM